MVTVRLQVDPSCYRIRRLLVCVCVCTPSGGSGVSRGSVSGGRAAAMCGARAPRQAAGHHGKTRAQLGLVEPLPDRFVPVPAAEAVLPLSVPAAAVHDGRGRL